MTRDDALTIVGMVVTAFPSKEQWDADVMLAYAGGIQDLDAEVTTLAVERAHKHERFRPSVAVLRAYAQEIARSRKPTTTFAGHEEQQILPAWVKGWAIARYRDGDMRCWPEQKEGYDELQEMHPQSKDYVWPFQEIMPEEDRARFANQGAYLTDEQVLGLIGA